MELRSGNWTPCWFIAERLECNVFTPPISPCSVGTVFARCGLRSVQHRLPKARRAQIMAGGWGSVGLGGILIVLFVLRGMCFSRNYCELAPPLSRDGSSSRAQLVWLPSAPTFGRPENGTLQMCAVFSSVLCTVPVILLLSADSGWFWYLISGAL